jgi:hypothetical protein
MYFIGTRIVGMQHTLGPKGLPTGVLTIVIIAALGMFKGVLFLLPIDSLKKATQNAERHFNEIAALQRELDEDMRIKKFRNAWILDFACPTVRVKILSTAKAASDQEPIAFADIQVPLMQTGNVDAILRVPFKGAAALRFWGSRPSVSFHVKWNPDAVPKSHSDDNVIWPRGSLTLEPIQAFGFASHLENSMWCHFEVPCTLFTDEETYTTALPSTKKVDGSIIWEDQSKNFQIKWEVPWNAKPVHKAIDSKFLAVEHFQEKVLDTMRQQSLTIGNLEKTVKNLHGQVK